MKRILPNIALLLVLSACSFNDVMALLVTTPTALPPPPAVVETATPTVFSTPGDTPTITPIPTYTSTPTLVGRGADTANASGLELPTYDAAPLPTLILVPSVTPGPQISFMSEPGSMIMSVSVSSDILFWGNCTTQQKYVDFDVRLTNNLRVVYVLLFMRLVDKGGNQSTAWGGGAMMKQVTGSLYTYRITPKNVAFYDEFQNAWLEYQVVVTTYGWNVMSSSPVSKQDLTLKKCIPIEADE